MTVSTHLSRRARAEADYMVAVRRRLHACPELSNEEHATTRFVADELRRLGLQVDVVEGRPGVVATWDTGVPGLCVALRADLDALPIDEQRASPYRSQRRNVMHACGHDGHTALMLGVARMVTGLAHLRGRVRFLFQPAEEDAPRGGARDLVARGGLDGVSRVLGVHLWPDLPVGSVGLRAGPVMAASDPLRLVIEGRAAHAAAPHEGTDAIVVAAHVVQLVQSLVARWSDPRHPAVVSIGTIAGGSRRNIVCDRVEMSGTVRCLDEIARRRLHERLRAAIEQVAGSMGARASIEIVRGYPPLVNDPETVAQVREVAGACLDAGVVVDLALPTLHAEDFAVYLEERPGAFLFLGCRNEARGMVHPLHSAEFDFDEEALTVGATVVAAWCVHVLTASSPMEDVHTAGDR